MVYNEFYGLSDERYGEFSDVVDGYERGLVPVDDLFDSYYQEEPIPQNLTSPTTEWDDVLQRKIAKEFPVDKYTPEQWEALIESRYESADAVYELDNFANSMSADRIARLKQKLVLDIELHDKAFFDNIKLAAWFARETMGFHRSNNLSNGQDSPILAFSNTPLDSFRYAQLPFADRFQIACISLYDSIDKYHPNKGSFSGFALNRMRTKLSNEIADNSQDFMARINPLRQHQIRTLLRMHEEAQVNGEKLNIHDATYVLGLPQEKDKTKGNMFSIEVLQNALMRFSNLDIEFVDEMIAEMHYDDFMTFDDEQDYDTHIGLADVIRGEDDLSDPDVGLKVQVDIMLSDLTEREQDIVTLRFGLDGRSPLTLEEVGKLYGLTREGIRQIEAKTLAKLRHPQRSELVKEHRLGGSRDVHESFRPEIALIKNEILGYINDQHRIVFDHSPSKKYVEKPKKKFVYQEDWTDEEIAS